MNESIDDTPTSGRVKDPGIRALYTMEARWQAWLDVEAALALAQAEVGLVPIDAARGIAAAARLDRLDLDRVKDATLRTSHTLVPLVWELARVSGDDAGRWVHWGATTQNIVHTGDVLQLRGAHEIVKDLLGEILLSMSHLATIGAEMLMAGRTHGQHAVPTTFGFKVAVWVDEMLRHVDRLREIECRTFVAMLGGAVGTFASLGSQGPAIEAALAARLGLKPMDVPARTSGDFVAEYVGNLGLLGGSCGKIAREIYTLMKTEFGEVEEPIPTGTVGSSTMPQKRNPHLCQDIISAAASLRTSVPLAFEAMQTEHEADRATSLMMQDVIKRSCITAGDMLARLAVVTGGLRLRPSRMRKNVELTEGLIMAEPIMLELGRTIGRQKSHDVVYEAAQGAVADGSSFASALAADARVTAYLSPSAIDAMMDPANYTGLSADMAHEAARRAREVAQTLCRGPSG